MMFKDKPADFNKKFDVVGCFIEHDGKFLMLHRLPHKPNGDTWGLPAGKVDPGEDLFQAVAREVREETGVIAATPNLELFDSLYVRHGDVDFEWHMFFIKLNEKPEVHVNANEHIEYAWVEPEQSVKLKLVDDQLECIELFYGNR